MKKEQIYQIADLNTKIKMLMEEQAGLQKNKHLQLEDPYYTSTFKPVGPQTIELTDADRAALVQNRQIEINKIVYTIEQMLLATGRDEKCD